MRINSINTTPPKPAFKGKFHMNVSDKDIDAFQKVMFPVIQNVMKDDVSAFVGTNPFLGVLDMTIKDICEANNASKSWLFENAKIHGLQMPEIPDIQELWIVTGKKDNITLGRYLKKRVSSKTDIVSKIKSLFTNKSSENYEKYPAHLRMLAKFVDTCKVEDEEFKTFVRKNNFIEAKDFDDLTKKILEEYYRKDLQK